MVSLYNLLFGRNPLTEVILATLDLTPDAVGRLRDCFVADGEVAVYTRNGGGNRTCSRAWRDGGFPRGPAAVDCGEAACHGCIITHRLPQHPCYLRDADDDFDRTYATVYFRFPARYAEFLAAVDTGTFNPDQRWLDYFARMQQPDYKVPEAVARLMADLVAHLKEPA